MFRRRVGGVCVFLPSVDQRSKVGIIKSGYRHALFV